MKEFIIFIREDLERVSKLSESDFQKEIEEYTKWVEEMSETGNFISGDPLDSEGKYIHKDKIESDGPFIESKEAISGYVMIKAKNLEEATILAKKMSDF